MSPNVGNFVHDLVEMAKAMETLPQVQSALDSANQSVEDYARQVQRLEMKLMDRANEIESLNARIHEAEVAKDAAETMFLEADDRTARALDFIKATFGNAGSLIQALEPPKPMPEPVAEPIPTWATPEVDHTGDYIPKADAVPSAQADATKPSEPQPFEGSGGGLSQPLPDATPPQGERESPLPDASGTVSPSVNPVEDQPEVDVTSAKPLPYAGKRYHDFPTYISRTAWLEGGGTQEDYDWRPSRAVAY